MKRYIKAALYSGLVFPGTGHIYLKRYIKGLVIILIAMTALVFIITVAVNGALKVVENMQILNNPDAGNVSNLVSASMGKTSVYYDMSEWILIVCWLYAIIDAYQIGKRDSISEKQGTDEFKL
ncbi:MAG: DUF6677 family protein [Syntrophales bacterium]